MSDHALPSWLALCLLALASVGCPPAVAPNAVPPKLAPAEVQPAFPATGVKGGYKLAPALERHLDTSSEKAVVPVILELRRQIDADDKQELFEGLSALERGVRMEAQRKALIRGLKRLAATDQVGLLALLEALEESRQVRDVMPLWIVNAIGLRASAEVVRELAGFDEVERVHLDLERPAKGAVAWGVAKIGADQVWNATPGYDGAGTVVAVLDSGVQYDHPSLVGRMWVNTQEDLDGDGALTSADVNNADDDGNGFVDDVHGYNFSGSGSHDPYDVAGHGTHVAGTIAGIDAGSAPEHPGVAPGAKIMALRETTTNTLSTQQECWKGMEYALDNDADVVNFSSGWFDAWSPAYELWRNAVDNVMDGGVLFVTIPHNDYNVVGTPNNVRTPGRVPSALTVGATNDTDAIPSFSDRGPVTWQTVSPFFDYPWPPGLTKPDVAAPGVAVLSAQRGSPGLVTDSGTSFAAPHAAGLAAILRQKNPTLTAYELRYVLEETAVDLAPNGPDNASGWGRIDAQAAVAAASIPSAAFDLAIAPAGSEWTSTDIWVDNDDDGTAETPKALSNNHLYARVRNLGGEVVVNVELKFYFAEISTIGTSGFDPNGDGDPSDGNFSYIGSYVVPILGPSGSKHDTAVGLVNWNIPAPPGTHWCVGVGVVAPSGTNGSEADTSNNHAFRNFVEILTTMGDLDFQIVPPPKAPTEPFTFEIRTRSLPKDTRIWLVLDRSLERLLLTDTTGLQLGEDATRKEELVSEVFRETLDRDRRWKRYEVSPEGAELRSVKSPGGKPLPVRIVVDVPPGAARPAESRIVLSTVDRRGERVGGLALDLVPSVPGQKGGPFLPGER